MSVLAYFFYFKVETFYDIRAPSHTGTQKDQVGKLNPNCPKGETIDKVTLAGGIHAGSFRDHGKLKEMNLCRRICCEMPKCNLAFMLGGSCFSVECKNAEACKTQPANPSQLSPQVSYVRNFGSMALIGKASFCAQIQVASLLRGLVP